MSKLFLIALLSLILFSCSTKYEGDLPACIEDIIEQDVNYDPIKTVRVQRISGEFHFWLNTDARHYDGVELIVNENCDTICFMCGECIPPECLEDYKEGKWEIVWP